MQEITRPSLPVQAGKTLNQENKYSTCSIKSQSKNMDIEKKIKIYIASN